MTIFLLDLEETVIDNWEDCNIILPNIEKIKSLGINKRCKEKVGIFSWAMWNERDLDRFNDKLREPLEDVLDIKFDSDLVFTMERISEIVLILRKKKMSIEDMFDIFGKEECLLTMFRFGLFGDRTTFLIDDKVDHLLKFEKADKTALHFLNIDADWN